MANDQPRPMLAAKYDEACTAEHLKADGYLIMQPKIDGMRVLFDGGLARSRSWKLWTNRYLKAFAAEHAALTDGWDGEMVPGHSYDPEVFRKAMSGLRSEDGSREFTYFLFDNWTSKNRYNIRRSQCEGELALQSEYYFKGVDYHAKVVLCPEFRVRSIQEIDEGEAKLLSEGWEGAILRRPHSLYKWNRATSKGGELTKLKRFEDAEAVIVGLHPAYENQNEAQKSLLGYTTRSAHQANLVAKDYLGSMDCVLLQEGKRTDITFNIGVFKGLSHEQRRELLLQGEALHGKIVNFSHQGYGGGYDKPRTPVFQRFRDVIDL
jgi:DNA ligase-1